eukprot:515792-Hanusia_phi.AAC.1
MHIVHKHQEVRSLQSLSASRPYTGVLPPQVTEYIACRVNRITVLNGAAQTVKAALRQFPGTDRVLPHGRIRDTSDSGMPGGPERGA